jgi:hypothetical protein
MYINRFTKVGLRKDTNSNRQKILFNYNVKSDKNELVFQVFFCLKIY